jgi:hypothetical protein
MDSITQVFIVIAPIFGFIFWMKENNKANNYLKIIDQKIKEFSNKTFSSSEEKNKAKQELKSEIVEIKSRIHFQRIRRQVEDRIFLL